MGQQPRGVPAVPAGAGSPLVSRRVAAAEAARLLGRSAMVGLATVAALLLLSVVVPGFALVGPFNGFAPAAGAAAVVFLVNAVVWPLLSRLVIGVVVVTFGVAAFVLNAALVWLGLALVPGVRIGGPLDAAAVTVVASAASAFTAGVLPLDRAAAYRRSLRRSRRRFLGPARRRFLAAGDAGRVPGVVFLQIDGLSGAALRRAVDAGRMPTVARWLADGSHRLLPWYTGAASQTAASQCGLLFGDDTDVPSFRWLEKESGRIVVANRSEGARVLQARRSDGRGLLHADGGACAALVSGDADDAILTMSMAGTVKGSVGNGYGGYFADPGHTVRTAGAFVVELVREPLQALAARLRGVTPRVSRGGIYPVLRALTTVVTRDVTVQWLVDNLVAGRSVLYADLLGYDEVAHHSGIDRPDSLAVLTDTDRRLARIEFVAREVARPYRLVLLSDHGQSPGETFQASFGVSLDDTVRVACGMRPHSRHADARVAELESSWAVAAALAQARSGPVRDRAVSRLDRGGSAEPSPAAAAADDADDADDADGDLVVLASGGLGLVSFPGLTASGPLVDPASAAGADPRRLRATREVITAAYPDLLDALRTHPGIGFVVVADTGGVVVLGAAGERHLAPVGSPVADRVVGTDPLAGFGARAGDSLRRVTRFPHAPDVLVQGALDPGTGSVVCFEHFAASHGSLGGEQTDAFVLAPVDLPVPAGWAAGNPLDGAVAVHHQFRGWLAHLGHRAFVGDRRPVDSAHGPSADAASVVPPSSGLRTSGCPGRG